MMSSPASMSFHHDIARALNAAKLPPDRHCATTLTYVQPTTTSTLYTIGTDEGWHAYEVPACASIPSISG